MPANTRPKPINFWPAAVLMLTPLLLAAGTTYKWTDADGQVHYSDTPPVGQKYETVTTVSPGPPPPPPSAAADRVPTVPAQATPARAHGPVAVVQGPANRDARCVEALYQLGVLNRTVRAYKPGPGNTRTYLDDRDRPAEIARLERERGDACSEDPTEFLALTRHASLLRDALTPGCFEAREKLDLMRRPSARSPRGEIERQQQFVERYCPDPHVTDVWLADWILVRARPAGGEPPRQ
jgi:hypothetical protein